MSVFYCYRWLNCLLSRIEFQAKAFVMNASRDREEASEKITQILHRLNAIEKQQDKVMADLWKYLKERTDETVQQLSEYLSSEEVKARFITFDSLTVNEMSVTNLVSRRFQEIIQEWEEEHRVFTNARQDLLQYFQQRYSFVEEQLLKLQIATTTDGLVHFDFAENSWHCFFRRLVFVSKFTVQKVFGPCNRTWYFESYALGYLASAARKNNLVFMVQQQFQQAELFLKQIESRIPELIHADKKLYEELIDESRTNKELQEIYQPIMDQGSEFRGQLMEFGIKEVCAVDVSAEELDWKEDCSSLLGSGAFGAVYQGTMSRNRNVKTVALKVCSDVLNARNACSLMEEVETLR